MFSMEKLNKTVALLLSLLVVISSWISISECSKKPSGVARKEDIPYVKCQVCEKLAYQLYQQVQAKQAEISPKKVTLHLGSSLSFCLCYFQH